MAITQVSDVIVPEIFSPYMLRLSAEKSALITSGAVVRSAAMDAQLAAGGKTFNFPGFNDLANDEDNVSGDEASGANDSTAKKTTTFNETYARLSRNQSWAVADIASTLAGADPMGVISSRFAAYWAKRYQNTFISVIKGILADNSAVPTGTEHAQNDLTYDASASAYSAGTTDFSGTNLIATLAKLGDAQLDLTLLMVHSNVHTRMLQNNLITFIQPSEVSDRISTYQGKVVIMDDSMPFTTVGGSTVYESWLFGPGAVSLGFGSAKVPLAVERDEKAANGAGVEVLHSRVDYAMHPTGHQFVGTPTAAGGPSNASTTNNLANATSYQRVALERKQIKIARLITRES